MSKGGRVVPVGLCADSNDRISVSACGCGLVVSVRILCRSSDCNRVIGFSAGALSDGNGVLPRGPGVLSNGDGVGFGFIHIGGSAIVPGSRNGPFSDGDGVVRECPRTVSDRNGSVADGLRTYYGTFLFGFSSDGDRIVPAGYRA